MDKNQRRGFQATDSIKLTRRCAALWSLLGQPVRTGTFIRKTALSRASYGPLLYLYTVIKILGAFSEANLPECYAPWLQSFTLRSIPAIPLQLRTQASLDDIKGQRAHRAVWLNCVRITLPFLQATLPQVTSSSVPSLTYLYTVEKHCLRPPHLGLHKPTRQDRAIVDCLQARHYSDEALKGTLNPESNVHVCAKSNSQLDAKTLQAVPLPSAKPPGHSDSSGISNPTWLL